MLATGLRVGEAVCLKWSDIDFENCILTVNKTQIHTHNYYEISNHHPNQKYIIGPPKTRASNRKIPLLPEVIDTLEKIKIKQNDFKLNPNFKNQDFIFCNAYTGNMISADSVRQELRYLCDILGIERLHPHSLRHTFTTRCVENGIDLKTVSELLGHSNIKMTANIYTHISMEKKQTDIMKLSDTINL